MNENVAGAAGEKKSNDVKYENELIVVRERTTARGEKFTQIEIKAAGVRMNFFPRK